MNNRWHVIFAVLILAFLFIQLNAVNYGTTINDMMGSRLVNPVIEDNPDNSSAFYSDDENPTQWHQRFMLYSIDADEMLSIMALSRIKPAALQFDPQYYQYGGAWLYPLGVWFAALNQIGVLSVSDMETMLKDPDRMDGVYIWGRIFVVLAFTASAIVLYVTLLHITSASVATFIVGIYLFCPASVIMSQTMKPHWYALLWVNGALYFLVRSFIDNRLSIIRQLLLAIFLALAVGSATTFALFSVFVWLALLFFTIQCREKYQSLVLVPAISILIFVFTNPYIFINFEMAAEEYYAISSWFKPEIGLQPVWDFLVNSSAPGFGIAFTALIGGISLYQAVTPSKPYLRWIALAVISTVLMASFMQANLSGWHLNFRYAPFFLTGAALLVIGLPENVRGPVAGFVLAMTVFQSVPIILAYADENNPKHSTRLNAATWVYKNVSPGTTICLNTPTPAPFNAPPLALSNYRINEPDCKLRVHVERIPDQQGAPKGWGLKIRFSPRLSNPAYPLVIGHINPQISVYEPL